MVGMLTWMGTEGDDVFDYDTANLMLVGRAGNDTYVLDIAGTYFLVEQPGEGIDTVKAAFDYTLDANIENLILTGSAISGTGNSLANRIEGNTGDNFLDGGAGNDVLVGGFGNDTYYVDSAGDVIIELPDLMVMPGDPPNDVVIASVSYTLSANIETLQFAGTSGGVTGIGNASANTIIGTAFSDVLSGLGGDDWFNGDLGNDSVSGGDGNDTLHGSTGNDTLNGDAGIDVLWGGDGNDVLNGGAGNDTLHGDAGRDTLAGGAGDDLFWLGAELDPVSGQPFFDTVSEAAGGGVDTVSTGGSYSLTANVENLFLSGEGGIGTGNALNNSLRGSYSNDVLIGLGGNDMLDGQLGSDRMEGGAGNDTYLVNGTDDVVVEAAGAGNDRVYVSGFDGYVLAANVEELIIMAGGADVAYGNELANLIVGDSDADTLYGRDGNDRLDGGDGADVLAGGAGNDTYVLDTSQDVVLELSGAGTDLQLLTDDNDTYVLSANVENATAAVTGFWEGIGITGNALANVLTGSNGWDRIEGGSGVDRMVGLQGSDTYVVDNAGDVVVEAAGQGEEDEVRSSVSIPALAANVEMLTLLPEGGAIDGTGNALNNEIRGNNAVNTLNGGLGNDSLYGLAGNDFLFGNDGNDTLDGGAGIDSMTGGAGNDTYFVDQLGDVINESSGTDEIRSQVSFDLGISAAQVENLRLEGAARTGTGNSLNNVIIGNALANTLSGGVGNDTLDGGAGNDTMLGGAGNDTYKVDSAGDNVNESGGSGIDTVLAGIASYSLTADVENATITYAGSGYLSGNTLNNVLTGAAGNDNLYGDAGNDTLRGGAGHDWMDGGIGNDRMEGGAGNDSYVVDSGDGAGAAVTAEDVVVENANEGIDAVWFMASGNYVLPANVENFEGGEAGGPLALVTGNALDNRITGSFNADTLDGGAGNDVIFGMGGNDVIRGSAGNDTISGGLHNDTLFGGAGNDVLDGGGGNDSPMAGNDRMEGGTGDDTYWVDSGDGDGTGTTGTNEDQVIEAANAGIDTVVFNQYGNYTLPANVENLLVQLFEGYTHTGNALANVIKVVPLAWAATLVGGDGDDRFEFSSGGGTATVNGGSGSDSALIKSNQSTTISLAALERLDVETEISGATLALAGDSPDQINVTNKGLGHSVGLAGLPAGVPVHLNDFVGGPFTAGLASSGGGSDSLQLILSDVQSSLASSAIEIVELVSGGSVANAVNMATVSGENEIVISGSVAIMLDGLDNTITGMHIAHFDSNVTLNAQTTASVQNWFVELEDVQIATMNIGHGAGADVLQLFAAAGTDSFIGELVFTGSLNLLGGNLVVNGVDSAAVTIAGIGSKTVSGADTGMTVTATADANTLHLTGSGAADTFNFGTRFDSTDSVDGAGGSDVLNANLSGLGSIPAPAALDIQNVETLNFTLDPGDAATLDVAGINYYGGGTTVNISGSAGSVLTVVGADSSQNWNASGWSVTFIFEADPETYASFGLVGGTSNDQLRGGSSSDSFAGGEGNDEISGLGGVDALEGGLGNDTLSGGADADQFFFGSALGASNVDTILDFGGGDYITLDNSIFGALAAGTPVPAGAFYAAAGATAAAAADDRLVFNTSTGDLYYDSDGFAGASAVRFAVVLFDGVPATLSATDFSVIP